MGPTASGKSEVALELAERLGAEILSVDSMQVYRGMDIGTAKPSVEERARVPHHLIDLAEPEEAFSVAEFQEVGRKVLADLTTREVPALIAGGSGLHFRALVDPLEFPPTDPEVRAEVEALEDDQARAELEAADPQAGRHVDLANPRRVVRALEIIRLTGRTPSERVQRPAARAVRQYEPLVPFLGLGIDPGDQLEERVSARLRRMVDLGLVEEVANLADRLGPTARQAVGYKELLPVVRGECSLEEGLAETDRATMRLAEAQRRYFGRDPRLHWIPWQEEPQERTAAVLRSLGELVAWTL